MDDLRDDDALVAAFLTGEAQAFNAIVWRHQHRVRAFVAGAIPTVDDVTVDEISQDTFIAVHSKLSSWDPRRCAFTTWVLGIARNRALTALRDLVRRQRRYGHELEDALLAGSLSTLEDEVHHPPSGDRIAALQTCLDDLPEHVRILVLARYVDEQAYESLAEETGRSQIALRKMLSRARNALQACIQRRLSADGEARA